MRDFFEKRPWAVILVLFVLYGVVGTIDYNDSIRTEQITEKGEVK